MASGNAQTLHFDRFTVAVQSTSAEALSVGIFNGDDTQAIAAVTVSEDDTIYVYAAEGREVVVRRYEDYWGLPPEPEQPEQPEHRRQNWRFDDPDSEDFIPF